MDNIAALLSSIQPHLTPTYRFVIDIDSLLVNRIDYVSNDVISALVTSIEFPNIIDIINETTDSLLVTFNVDNLFNLVKHFKYNKHFLITIKLFDGINTKPIFVVVADAFSVSDITMDKFKCDYSECKEKQLTEVKVLFKVTKL